MKFFRRADLSSQKRLSLAIEAWLYRGQWGYITELAERYRVSRQFIYLLLWSLNSVFKAATPAVAKSRSSTIVEVQREKLITALKLDGYCSIGDISRILKLLDIPRNSVGEVSQFLSNLGGSIDASLPQVDKPIVILADEIFAGSIPVLVIMEARSHAVLLAVIAQDRKGTTWHHQFEKLKEDGYTLNYMVCDQGSGLANGASQAGVLQFPDLIHLMRPLDPYLGRFERQAIGTITQEYERQRVFNSARSESVLLQRLNKYDAAVQMTIEAITRYDNFTYLHWELHNAFNTFNPDGSPRTKGEAEADVNAVLELIENDMGKLPATLHDAIKGLRKALPSYWVYFERVEAILNNLPEIIPDEIVKELCLGWQAEKQSRSAKDYQRKKKLQKKAQDHFALAKCAEKDLPVEKWQQIVFDRLEDNVRSSSPLESTNALIRDHLNSCRGQITQKMLDLIVYSINHKIATRGPYKGTSPWQRLTGKAETTDYAEQILKFATSSSHLDEVAA